MDTRTTLETGSNCTPRNEDLKCWNSTASPLCLRIELADGTQYLQPYGYFEGATFRPEADSQILTLQFKEIQFEVRGKGLEELLLAFQTMAVEWMRECPRRYHAVLKLGPMIKAIKPICDESRS